MYPQRSESAHFSSQHSAVYVITLCALIVTRARVSECVWACVFGCVCVCACAAHHLTTIVSLYLSRRRKPLGHTCCVGLASHARIAIDTRPNAASSGRSMPHFPHMVPPPRMERQKPWPFEQHTTHKTVRRREASYFICCGLCANNDLIYAWCIVSHTHTHARRLSNNQTHTRTHTSYALAGRR